MLATVFTKTTRDRWKGITIGAAVLALMLLFGMAVYRDIDLSVYTSLPEAFRSLIGIAEDADAASLAYSAIYTSYGTLTLAALAVSMGAASIAGEERDGTIGLLLGNPKSRTNVLLSKAESLVLLTALGSIVLWGAGRIVPGVLDVAVGQMDVEALVVHMFATALFFGVLSMAVGAWTGRRGLASGVGAGLMVISFFAVGLLPLIQGWEGAAKAFPWYYLDGGKPLLNGIQWGHIGLLLGSTAVLAVAAVVGVNRRDLRAKSVGVTLVDRLRGNPLTKKVADRLAGSTRVSRIWIKTASEHQGLLFVTALVMFAMSVMIGPMYTLIDDALASFADNFPDAVLAMVGGGDMSTAEGFYQVEIFGLMAPISIMIVTVVIGARALAGEEAQRTMGLLLANPISRSTVVLEKTVAMLLYGAAVGFVILAGVAAGSAVAGLGIDIGNIAATCLLVTLLGLAFGAFAVALSAATGRVRLATYGTTGLALVLFLVNAFLPLTNSLGGWAKLSPFYYYLSSDPLMTGMHWGHGAVLAALTVVLVAASVWLFQHRDLRQTG
jgi:ABC-2 type transport system permease protein